MLEAALDAGVERVSRQTEGDRTPDHAAEWAVCRDHVTDVETGALTGS